jgi:hypothetical protein
MAEAAIKINTGAGKVLLIIWLIDLMTIFLSSFDQ